MSTLDSNINDIYNQVFFSRYQAKPGSVCARELLFRVFCQAELSSLLSSAW